MIPIYSYWCDGEPTDEEINCAINKIQNNELSIIQLNWRIYGYPHCITVQHGMTLEDCKEQMPKIYAL